MSTPDIVEEAFVSSQVEHHLNQLKRLDKMTITTDLTTSPQQLRLDLQVHTRACLAQSILNPLSE